jgi:hypothetical protein
MGWTNAAEDRDQWQAHVYTVMNLRVPLNVRKFLSSWATGGFARRTWLHGVSRVVKMMCSKPIQDRLQFRNISMVLLCIRVVEQYTIYWNTKTPYNGSFRSYVTLVRREGSSWQRSRGSGYKRLKQKLDGSQIRLTRRECKGIFWRNYKLIAFTEENHEKT